MTSGRMWYELPDGEPAREQEADRNSGEHSGERADGPCAVPADPSLPLGWQVFGAIAGLVFDREAG